MKRFCILLILIATQAAFGKTVSNVAILPQGAVLRTGSNLQFTVVCTYSDSTTDNCSAAGGATWSSSLLTKMTVNSSGVATWVSDPGANKYDTGYIVVAAGGLTDKAGVYGQHPGDVWTTYMTPDPSIYNSKFYDVPQPLGVAVGATVALGYGFQINGSQNNPLQVTCTWTSSDPSVATINRIGDVTAVAPGSVVLTCERAGDGVYGTSSKNRWVSPGNVITLTVVNGGTGNQTWYVRPGGGLPYTNATDTPVGQCDGKHDADYPGQGVNQPCAMGSLRYLWSTEVGYANLGWIISGGDTIIVRQKDTGYKVGGDAIGVPGNCLGNPNDCFMPTIPSGTAARHTRILGENYANCTSDAAKTKLLGTFSSYTIIDARDSQFVDVQCFDISDRVAYGAGNFTLTPSCPGGGADCGSSFGVLQSALTASVNFKDLLIHGLVEGIHGATGVGVVADHIHLRGNYIGGIDMDDSPFGLNNISVAGGLTLTNSTTEFTGCIEEYPVVHNYPYIECRDQNTGGYADGLGTGSTSGDWVFDHDLWFANFQDGLDLLHSGMRSLSVTNSQSIANDGQAFKIGSADNVIFRNNLALVNCARILHTFGDEPASAIVPDVAACRASGDGIVFSFTDQGSYEVQNNSFVGYNSTMFDNMCEGGWDYCQNASTVFQNNLVVGYATSLDGGDGRVPGLFYLENDAMPAHDSWAVRDHNFYYNVRYCPTPLQTGETCSATVPGLTGMPASPIASPYSLDNFNFMPAETSPLIGAGVSLASILTDITGVLRPAPPAIGALQFSLANALNVSQVSLIVNPSTATLGQTVTFTASVGRAGLLAATGTVTFTSAGVTLGSAPLDGSGVATLSTSSLPVGSYQVIANYLGDSGYTASASLATMLTVGNAQSGKTTPQISLGLSASTIHPLQSETFTAAVTTVGGVSATGTITFYVGGVAMGQSALDGSGNATLSTSSLTAGTYVVNANYSGDSGYSSGVSNVATLTVSSPGKTTTQVSLDLSSNTIMVAQPVTLTAVAATIGGVVPTGSFTFTAGNVTVGTSVLNGAGVATVTTSSLPAGTYAVSASYSGDASFSSGPSNGASLTVRAAQGNISIQVGQPEFGFNVIPGSTRRIFATVSNGSTNQVVWTLKSGTATLSSNAGSWIDVTAPATGASCTAALTSANYSVTSSTQFTVEATAVDDGTKKTAITFNVCKPTVQISVVPFYRTLYAKQPADIQSLITGSVDQNVHWAITSKPQGGDGTLGDTTSRDTVFAASVPGRYTLTATSQADSSKTASAVVYVTGNTIPYAGPVTPNQTVPVDCSVDPTLGGTVYNVGPTKAFKTLASVPFPTMVAGSTVRIFNEDTSGINPTTYHEYVQLSQAGTATQPIRICGVPDTAGNQPVIDGAGATGRSDTSTAIGGLGLLTLHTDNNNSVWPKFNGAAYVAVEGIHFRNAKTGYSYVAPSGSIGAWGNSSACVRVNQGQNLAFVGNDFDSCGDGVYTAWNDDGGWGSSDLNVLWEGNHLHNNGVANADSHQMYLEAWGEVVQFNRIDNYTAGARGANLKSRGLQDVIRYNYFGDGPTRQMDLVDVTNGPTYMSFSGYLHGGAASFLGTHPTDAFTVDQLAAEQEAWNSHYAYGNIYQNSVSTAPFHFSMDTNGNEQARKGSLYWYNNTFNQTACSSCQGQMLTMFDTSAGNGNYIPQTEFPTVQSFNNIVWLTNPTQATFQWNNYDAFIGVSGANLLTANWGTNNAAGGPGSGWNATSNPTAYQGAENVGLHVTGFSQNLTTATSIPFSTVSYALTADLQGNQGIPDAVCEMPARFSYMPSLGYAIPRITGPNMGATDTTPEAAAMMTTLVGPKQFNTHYSNCR